MKAKRKQSLINKILLWVNYGLCAALIVSYLSPVTDPRKFWLIAFFGLAYPGLLLANVLMAFYWLIRKKWYFLLSVVTILAGWNVLINNVGFHTGGNEAIPPGNGRIRMMTYNVHDFKKYGSNNDQPTRHEILHVIESQHPDIINFQEFFTRKRGKFAMIDSIKRIMQADNYYFENFTSSNYEGIGMAIFSKFPIMAKSLVRLNTGGEDQCMYVDVKKDNREFRIYNVHLQSVQFGPADYKYLDTVTTSGAADMPSTKRLGGKLKRAFLKRAGQVFIIKAHAAQCPYPYIITGDFNDTPTSFAVNQMAKGLKNAFREKGFGLGRTYNGDFPNYQIDYILAVPQFDIMNYTIIEKKLSDHYPIVSDLILK